MKTIVTTLSGRPSWTLLLPVLLGLCMATCSGAIEATVSVNTQEIANEVDPRILGHYLEGAFDCIYGGIWETSPSAPYGKPKEDVLELTRALNPTIVRWPGGLFADGYRWVNGIGPKEQRPLIPNAVWGVGIWGLISPLDPNTFGSHEYMQLMKTLDAEPYICVNMGVTGNATEAARWVEYMNGSQATPFGELRAVQGYPEPYGVKLWGVGNESFAPWSQSYSDPLTYALRFREYALAMRAVDPSLQLVAVGDDYNMLWNRLLLYLAGDQIDFLSLHAYYPVNVFQLLSPSEDLYYSMVSIPVLAEASLASLIQDIEAMLGPNSRVKLILDEWNSMFDFSMYFVDFFSARDVVTAGALINMMIRHADYVKVANFAALVNIAPLIKTANGKTYTTAMYPCMLMYSRLLEEHALPVTVTGPTFRATPLFWGQVSFDAVPFIDVSSTRDAGGQRLTVNAVNRHFSESCQTRFRLEGMSGNAQVRVWEVAASSPYTGNSFEAPDGVRLVDKGLVAVTLPEFSLTLPPHSVTGLELILE